jgi:import inner membrane translocase subunit TIM23
MQPNLTWAAFFSLRKSQRLWEKIGGATLGVSSFLGGTYYFGAVKDFDPLQPIFGMDPYIAYSGASFLIGAAGAVGGLSLSSQVWRLAQNR